MELIEIPKDELFVGMSLDYTLRDASGLVLLASAHKIETQQQLDGIRSRAHVYVDIDQTGGGMRAVMSSLSALDHAGAPIKDFSKYLNIRKSAQTEDAHSGNLAQRWAMWSQNSEVCWPALKPPRILPAELPGSQIASANCWRKMPTPRSFCCLTGR